MKVKVLLPVLLALAACATGETLPPGETRIPFVSSTRVIEWRAVADDSVYVRGGNGDWYLVRTSNRCTRLHTATSLGFVTSALDQLDRFGAILAQGQRCPVASIIRAEPPAKVAR